MAALAAYGAYERMSHDSSGPRPTPHHELEAQPTTDSGIIAQTTDTCQRAVRALADQYSEDEHDADLLRYLELLAEAALRVDEALSRYDQAQPGAGQVAAVREIETLLERVADLPAPSPLDSLEPDELEIVMDGSDREDIEELLEHSRTWDPDEVSTSAARAVLEVVARRGVSVTARMSDAALSMFEHMREIADLLWERELATQQPDLDRARRRGEAQLARAERRKKRKEKKKRKNDRRRGRGS